MKGLAKRLTAAALLTAVSLTATMYSRARPVELQLGFMAGSYWDAPNGDCYAVIDAAVERFEREHPNVHVTYTSGILKRDYSEWLIDQYLLGSEPDVFLVLPEDFGTLCELGALEPLDGLAAFDGVVVFYTHGHMYGVKYDLDTLADAAAARGANVALFGHTHIPVAEERGGVFLFNPGSCGRCYTGPNTYGILTLADGKVVSHEHKEVPKA